MAENNSDRVDLNKEINKTNQVQPPQPSPQDQGHQEAIKESAKEGDKNISKFKKLIDDASKELFRFKSVFPFDLFPDEVVVDINKVNIIKRISVFGERVHSVFIQDISDVFITNNILFSTLEIVDTGFTENSIQVKNLKKSDAARARRIIQGLVIARKQQIDLSSVYDEELALKLEKLGESRRSK
jgi:hypothetical protein